MAVLQQAQNTCDEIQMKESRMSEGFNMTEYRSGFISSIIDRSDQILNRGRYDVTRLLMLLSVGYAMVWERLKFHSNDTEEYVSDPVKGNKFEKKLEKSTCDGPLRLGSFQYFETFYKSDEWQFYEVSGYRYKYTIEDLIDAEANK